MRLKYFDFDSSFNARKGYYPAMGGTGTYTGSASQNTWMVEQMRQHGYAKGVYNIKRSQVAMTQEHGNPESIVLPDGSIMTPLAKHSSVINGKNTKALYDFASNPGEMINQSLRNLGITIPESTSQGQTISQVFNLNMPIDHVMDYDDLYRKMQKDANFEKLVQSVTTDRMLGGNKLKKYTL